MAEFDTVDEIKRRLNIIEVIGGYLPLKKAGRNFKGLCPFHPEKTPSFTVSPDKQVWHCFGCGAGGDLFSFIMRKEGVDFAEALQLLADKAGVRIERQGSGAPSLKKQVLQANQIAADFFRRNLEGESGREARAYIEKRGIKPETVKTFRIGYAPSAGLLNNLKTLNLSPQQLEHFGFAVGREQGLVDKFRHRLIFPIADHLGRIVAFTGRALKDDEEPKYLNSPETPAFVKGQVLYGLDLAKEEIGKRNFVVAVEGQMDAISSYQGGVTNVVAISGTAFTLEQAELLRRYTDKIILSFDNDHAGLEATKRSLPILSKVGFTVKVVKLPGKDPDSIIQQDVELWREALKNAQPAVEFFFEKAKEEFGFDTPFARQKVAGEVEAVIALLADPVERELYINAMALALGVGTLALKENVARHLETNRRFEPQASASVTAVVPPSVSFLEDKVFALLMAFPENVNLFLTELAGLEFSEEFFQHIYTALANYYTEDAEALPSSSLVLDSLPLLERTRLAERALVAEEEYGHLAPENIRQEITFYIRLLKDRQKREKRQALIEEIARVEAAGDQEALQKLLQKFREE